MNKLNKHIRYQDQAQQAHHYIKTSDPVAAFSAFSAQENTREDLHENTRAALTLLLGPDTEHATRVRAVRRLARQGPAILPLLLSTLSNAQEITAPSWPWWPPQYEHCSRLLFHLAQKAQVRLDLLLQHPALHTPAGPVLWICVIEATNLHVEENYEALLCEGLQSPWMTVRYAASMALATRASRETLTPSTLALLKEHQGEWEAYQIRLTVSYALLISGESSGIEVLTQLADVAAPEEVRRAAAFILATEIALPLSETQQERLAQQLLSLLYDFNAEIALLAARALRHIKLPSTVQTLGAMLRDSVPQVQQHVLAALEEMARRPPLRSLIVQQGLLTDIVPFLRSAQAELRRQACYTLVAIGGEYVTAVLGTVLLTDDHPGYLEALESLRLLPDALRATTRSKITRWLLHSLHHPDEEVQITILDSLTYLLWRARTQGQKRIWHALSADILDDGRTGELLHNASPLVRQRTVELLGLLDPTHQQVPFLHMQMRPLLHHDPNSHVRSSVAMVYGEVMLHQALPDLLQALLDTDETVAESAFSALERMVVYNASLITYIARELSYYHTEDATQRSSLTQHACNALKKWSQAERHKKHLHSPA